MNVRMVLPFIVAGVLGLIAVVIVQDILKGRQQPGCLVDTAKVVIANQALEPGCELRAADLRLIDLPRENIPQGALANPAAILGRAVAYPIAKGQTVVESSLAPYGAGLGLQALVPPGSRAVTVEVNEHSGMAGLLTPGCHVDVLVSFADEKTRRMIARTILENITVIAVGREISARTGSAASSTMSRANSVTLLVTPGQAEILELTTTRGRLRLVLRNGRDTTSGATTGVTSAELVGADSPRRSSAAGDHDDRIEQVFRSIHAIQAHLASLMPMQSSEKQNAGIGGGAAPGKSAMTRRSVQLIKGGTETVRTFDMLEPADSSPDTHGGIVLRNSCAE